MSVLDTYKLPLKSMSPGRYDFEFRADKAFFEAMESDDISNGDVDVRLAVQFDGDIYTLHIAAKGSITVACDRCLDDMTLPVDTTYDTIARYGDINEAADDDAIIITPGQTAIDVAPVIYDTIALCVPLQHVHPDGQCNVDMSSRLSALSVDEAAEYDDDIQAPSDPRWDALKNLKDNN